MGFIKTYEDFAPMNLLHPHSTSTMDEPSNSKMSFFLATLYEMADNNIMATANKIASLCKSNGFYINVKHLDSRLDIIRGNEPNVIFGAEAGGTINIGSHNGIPVEEDSIVIHQTGDGSLFILSIKDNYQITFIKPKVVVSEADPYGEEDWGEHEFEDDWEGGE